MPVFENNRIDFDPVRNLTRGRSNIRFNGLPIIMCIRMRTHIYHFGIDYIKNRDLGNFGTLEIVKR